MKIFEVAGVGKLHGLTVMSLDAFVKKDDQEVDESATQGLAEDWDSIPDRYKNDIEEFKKLWPNEKASILAKAHIIKTDGHSNVITKGEKWDNFWKRNEPIEIKTPYDQVDFDALYKKAKHDYAVLHSDREDELGMGAAGRRELQQRAEELAEMKRVTLRNERLHDEEVAFQRAETIQQRKDEMKKIADKYNHELAVINAEHSNNMQAIRTGNNHEINKMNMEYQHEKEMWDKNNPKEEVPTPDDEEEYVRPQQSGDKFDQDTGEPIKPAGSQQSNQWHTSQQLTSPTKPTKPGKEDDDVTDVEPKPNKPLALGNGVKKESAEGGRAVDAKGRTQSQWLQAVRKKFPDAKIMQSKMIDGPCYAMLADGRKLAWSKVESSVAESSLRVDSLVTKGLKIMRGPKWLDAVAAIKYQVGERDYRERKEFYDFFVKQLVDMYGKKDVAEGAEQMTPNWAKYVLDQIYNSNGAVTLTDLFDEGIPGLHAMFMATAKKHDLDPEEDFEDVQHELTVELEDWINSKFVESNLSEAPGDFGLGANYRAVPDDEMQQFLDRSKTKNKTKRDKFDYPYVHGSNIEVKDEGGKKFDTEKLKAAIMTRPANILGQNAKMQHSETGEEAIFDIGLPALKGLAVNEKTGEFVIVDTCPGAGACKTFCYAMKGSYVMFKAVSMGLARMLNFLLNDPEGFASKLNSEIAAAKSKMAKKNAKVVVRWHDAGDFFSAEYLAMAYSVARANPDVGFYAYTKMADVATGQRPKNFNMNFSGGALSSQEKKVDFQRVKHSKVVPKDMFFDLIARDGNSLKKDAKGRMQFASPENLDKFKSILAQKYAVAKDSILTYDEMMKTPVGDSPKWNVIVMPGDGDNSANRNDVVGSYLLFH
jgi:hypothetical protein